MKLCAGKLKLWDNYDINQKAPRYLECSKHIKEVFTIISQIKFQIAAAEAPQ